MPSFLQISDNDFRSAAQSIANFLIARGLANVVVGDIEQQLRSYVYLGQHKAIDDWSYLLSNTEKDAIVDAVVLRARQMYTRQYEASKVYNNLDIMLDQSNKGSVALPIARPRYFQSNYEQGVSQETPIANQNILTAGIEKFVGVIRDIVESTLRGLGIDIPLNLIIVLIVAVVGVVLFKKFNVA